MALISGAGSELLAINEMNESRENDTWINQASRDARATTLSSQLQSQLQHELKWLASWNEWNNKERIVVDCLRILQNNLRSYDALIVIHCVFVVLESEEGTKGYRGEDEGKEKLMRQRRREWMGWEQGWMGDERGSGERWMTVEATAIQPATNDRLGRFQCNQRKELKASPSLKALQLLLSRQI